MVDNLIQFAIFFGVFVGIRLSPFALRPLIRAFSRYRARRRSGPGPWSLALLVHLDEQTGLIHPSVQVFGNRLPKRTKLTLEVVDPRGVTRYSVTRRVPPSAAGREVDMGGFRCPGADFLEEPLTWRWNVTMRAGRRRLAETTETLYEAGGFNDEAEIVIG